jgi:pSer/pThr/pTyr-binding forkhead associated (FHA) protein
LDWGDDEAATSVQRDAASLSLIAREGPMAGHIFGTDGHPITIGRGSSCAVRLALSEISRRHATIRYHAGRYWVEDLQTLNGTRVNEQLIDGPTPLKRGDRIRVGMQEFEVRFDALANREVVFDGPNSEALVSTPPQQQQPTSPVRRSLSPLAIGAVGVLALSTGVLFAFAITRQRSRTPAAQTRMPPPTSATAANDAVRLPPPAAASTTIRAHFEMDGAVALTAPEAGTVRWAAARGTPARSGDDLVRFRRDNTAKQRELDRINAQLEDDDRNPQLVRRAHALADEMAASEMAKIKSDFDGVVIASSPPGARLQPGVAGVHVARRVRLVVDTSVVRGAGSACRVSFLDQRLEAEGRRVVGDVGATIELTRFPEALSLEHVGQVRASCK